MSTISDKPVDVVIIGSGPVGLAEACILKCMNKELKIVVMDKRPDTTRKHGLKIETDTVKKIVDILEENLINADGTEKKQIIGLQEIFKKWGGNVIRTNDIEDELKNKADSLGVIVLRDEKYEATAKDLNVNSKVHSHDKNEKQKYLKEAKVIVGADGSHSVVRETVMRNELEHEKNLSYLIEFKFQTPQTTKRRTNWQAIKLFLKTGSVDFETMGKGNPDETLKPATLHVAVNKKTYDKFRPADRAGNPIKGTFQDSWSEDEINEASLISKEIADTLKIYNAYKKDVEKRGGKCEDLKISTIPMGVYRSKKVAENFHGKYVLLAGDASSGVVFGRGVNKGFQEAVICADKIDKYYKNFFMKKNQNWYRFTSTIYCV